MGRFLMEENKKGHESKLHIIYQNHRESTLSNKIVLENHPFH